MNDQTDSDVKDKDKDKIDSSRKAKEAFVSGLDFVLELHRKSASTNCALVNQNCVLIELNKDHCSTIKLQQQKIDELTNKIFLLQSNIK